jgi:hypothetical protein
MKLAEWTLTVLKNFSTVNSGIVLVPGKLQRTISPESSILVEAEFEDEFPSKFGIYDLNQFLGNVTTLKEPELKFSDKYVTMSDETCSLSYMSCEPQLITAPPNKNLVLDKPDVKFELPNLIYTKLRRIAAMNDLPNMSVIGKGGELLLKVHEHKNDTSNFATTKIGDYAGKDFAVRFKTDNLKIIPDDYMVEVKLDTFAVFTSKSRVLKYYIAVETR